MSSAEMAPCRAFDEDAMTGINLPLTDKEAMALWLGATSIMEDIDQYAIDAAAYGRAIDKLRRLMKHSGVRERELHARGSRPGGEGAA